MTKFRIFGPAGIEICTIEADSRVITPEKTIFYEAPDDIKSYHEILTDIPYGWVAIPDEIIVKNDNNKPVEVPSFEEAVVNARRFFGGD